ncbi:dynein 8 kDa light chain, flagellar outer arm-like [Megalobrama amblycephala]|uniref:dynein 8 kDa light chain, flagellar outer arm-like n=1 Tax=Megalobrama amblycephala TaxID=75352 RepID=UPI002013E7DE|nr:dynein 8 kDa light chain, flagellar outer arm-like [Megalobrama amblycephala]
MAYTAGCLILTVLFGTGAYGSTSVMLRTAFDIHQSDMSDEMQHEALQVTLLAVNMYKEDNDIARYIKMQYERRHWGTWACIIGSSGYCVSPKAYSYIDFSVGDKKITLFRSS